MAKEDYESKALLLKQMGVKTQTLILEILEAHEVRVLDVTHRVKSETSALRKIEVKSGSYSTFSDLHDMLGLRIITYLASDVSKVVELLANNFQVDVSRSLDKQVDLDPDRFGYLSHHLVATVHESRELLTEWSAFKGTFFEIQVRSILQHAWAEIEHDLGYKSASVVPAHLRRRFARLAGLLELADSEFDGVSEDVAEHVVRVQMVVATGENLAIDRDSIRAISISDGPVSRADRAIAKGIGAALEPSPTLRYSESRASELLDVGYDSLDNLRSAVDANFDQIVAFATDWFLRPNKPEMDFDYDSDDMDADGRYLRLSPGICLFYLYLHHRMMEPDGELTLTNIRGLEFEEEQEAFRRIHDAAFPDSGKHNQP